MRLLLRCDSSPSIGAGHQLRCLALAQAWRRVGGVAIFAVADQLESVARRIRDEDFEIQSVEDLLGSQADAASTCEMANGNDCDWLVLDGYQFRDDYQRSLNSFRGSVLAIDDFGQCDRWSIDAILNYNLFADSVDYSGTDSLTVLRGPDYALLREELTLSHPASVQEHRARRVLLTLGGSNVTGTLESLVVMLNGFETHVLDVRMTIGKAYGIEEIQSICDGGPHQYQLVVEPSNMAIQYNWADLVVCGAGGTCFECLYFQLPMAYIGIAENQTRNIASLQERQYGTFVGWADRLDQSALYWFLGNSKRQVTKAKVVDGLGATRTAKFMQQHRRQ